ncbi:hypothetical protein OROHE_006697 [Orobanche hederae]
MGSAKVFPILLLIVLVIMLSQGHPLEKRWTYPRYLKDTNRVSADGGCPDGDHHLPNCITTKCNDYCRTNGISDKGGVCKIENKLHCCHCAL